MPRGVGTNPRSWSEPTSKTFRRASRYNLFGHQTSPRSYRPTSRPLNRPARPVLIRTCSLTAAASSARDIDSQDPDSDGFASRSRRNRSFVRDSLPARLMALGLFTVYRDGYLVRCLPRCAA